MKRPQWYTVLLAARKIALESYVTSKNLASEVDLDVASASAWLSKFERWGYAIKFGKGPDGRRWSWRWVLTTYGKTRKAPGRSNQIRSEKPAERASRIAANPTQTRGKTSE